MSLRLVFQRHRKSLLRFALGLVIIGALSIPLTSFTALPMAFFYLRRERQFCLRCGQQVLEETRLSLGGQIRRSVVKTLFQPRDRVDSGHCDHYLLTAAAKDRFFDLRKLSWIEGSSGDIDDDHVLREPKVVKTFSTLMAQDEAKATDLFLFLVQNPITMSQLQTLLASSHDEKDLKYPAGRNSSRDNQVSPEVIKKLILDAQRKFQSGYRELNVE